MLDSLRIVKVHITIKGHIESKKRAQCYCT